MFRLVAYLDFLCVLVYQKRISLRTLIRFLTVQTGVRRRSLHAFVSVHFTRSSPFASLVPLRSLRSFLSVRFARSFQLASDYQLSTLRPIAGSNSHSRFQVRSHASIRYTLRLRSHTHHLTA